MNKEIEKMFRRIELDKANDSCGFEFADGFGCTFNNIATCYDDRLELYDLVKSLQSQLEQKEKQLNDIKEYVENKRTNNNLEYGCGNEFNEDYDYILSIIERNNSNE